MARVRSAYVDPPRYPVVSPEGLVKLVPVAQNITTALEFDEDGEVVMTKTYERKGWIMLETLYAQEGRSDLWSTWKQHRAALEAARKDGLSLPGFPDKYLPREVQRRRAGHRPQAVTWTMPDLPAVDMEGPAEVDLDPAPALKRGRKPKVEPVDPEV